MHAINHNCENILKNNFNESRNIDLVTRSHCSYKSSCKSKYKKVSVLPICFSCPVKTNCCIQVVHS